jgi:hypothetical protein
MPVGPCDAPLTLGTLGTGDTTGHSEPRVTMAGSPVLMVDVAIAGMPVTDGQSEPMRHDSYHHDTTFSQSGKKHDKQEWHKLTTTTMCIPGGHGQESPRGASWMRALCP